MIYSRITGTGSYLPGTPCSNADLIARHGLDSTPEWIVERTGIHSRHLAPAGVAASDLALEASRNALAAAGKEPNDIDLIVLATSTPDYIFPSTATILQDKLGMSNGAAAFDLQAVCGGFIYALSVADKFIRSGSHRRALVVGAETFSRILDWSDRGTCVLFGDGAGAVVLEASDKPGVHATALHADGRYRNILAVPGHLHGGQPTGDPFLRMDGQAVFKFAVKVLAEVAEEVMAAAGMTAEQVTCLVPHQANIRIMHATAKKLRLPVEKCIVTVDHHGNTSAASIPLALDEAVRSGKVGAGDTALLEGVGGGFTWGAAIITL
ncbi:MAG: beta-ketoacyl-ACP synthase III [Rhodocyclaceae bacterium]|nr:beta-ketoacyl-ACP synthase III [Rhodocyclaceae bacterium]MDZ4213327.1 beta-ketoacyl-ACP synthase III [Rhodocyclaceae bacterium]